MNRNNKGFTLLELMIIVAIVAILVAIAIPNYQRYILRSYRVDARNTLENIALKIEQNFKVTRQWNTLATNIGGSTVLSNQTLAAWGPSQSPLGGNARYNITFEGVPTAQGYTLRATAVGAQQADEPCASFFLTQSGVRMAINKTTTAVPSSGRDNISRECWTK